jgi:hypothetical protein
MFEYICTFFDHVRHTTTDMSIFARSIREAFNVALCHGRDFILYTSPVACDPNERM